ncbi:MAG: hypothetical protein APR63_10455 [Desulfuromonas sp. SDB]|nr:MAG: hypothetical protein APR63_10455 [Desulfuromonas sp. SDB]
MAQFISGLLKMKGIELSEAFFNNCIFPILKSNFPEVLDSISAAILGDGSEVLGFDDHISHDHNYTPRVILFLDDGRYDQYADELKEKLYQFIPKEFNGFKLMNNKYRKSLDIVPLKRYFLDYLGISNFPVPNYDWLKLDEQKLLELTSGKIFYVPHGKLEEIRTKFSFYPEAVRYFLLHQSFVRLSEVCGIERSILRNDNIATDFYRSFFIYFSIKIVHLYKKRYCPYRKWMGKNLINLDEEGLKLKKKIDCLVKNNDLHKIRIKIKEISEFLMTLIFDELHYEFSNLGEDEELYLLNFSDDIFNALKSEIPPELLNLSPVISPKSYWGMLFDLDGLGSSFRGTLIENIDFIEGR